jgi:hypothetical protein
MAANPKKNGRLADASELLQSSHLMVKSAEGERAPVDRAVAARRASKILQRFVRPA